MKKKVVFIVPGYGESPSLSRYKKVAAFFKTKKMEIVPVNIFWKYRVLSDYIFQFKKIFDKNKGVENYFFGFSFGAFIAFVSSIELKPKAIFVCSLSPYFKEDFINFPKSWKKSEPKKMVRDMKNFNFNNIVGKVNSGVYIFVGEKEHKLTLDRAKEIKNKIRKSKLVFVNGANHFLSQHYIDEIEKSLR